MAACVPSIEVLRQRVIRRGRQTRGTPVVGSRLLDAGVHSSGHASASHMLMGTSASAGGVVVVGLDHIPRLALLQRYTGGTPYPAAHQRHTSGTPAAHPIQRHTIITGRCSIVVIVTGSRGQVDVRRSGLCHSCSLGAGAGCVACFCCRVSVCSIMRSSLRFSSLHGCHSFVSIKYFCFVDRLAACSRSRRS